MNETVVRYIFLKNKTYKNSSVMQNINKKNHTFELLMKKASSQGKDQKKNKKSKEHYL